MNNQSPLNLNSLSLIPLLFCLLAVQGCETPEPDRIAVDLLLHSGNVLTLDDANRVASAIAVDGDRIVAVGNDELRDRYAAATSVDLAGATLMPGFIDTHVHIEGKPDWYIDLTKTRSIEQMRTQLMTMSDTLKPGSWITGYGWSEDELDEGRKPTIEDLDTAAPGHPIMLTRAGAHSAVFSSAAFALAGITEQTPDPEGGTIEKRADGSLNGIVRERHDALFADLLPPAPPAQLRASLARELQALFALGITSITQATGDIQSFGQWQEVYKQHRGALPRASVQLAYEGHSAMAASGLMTGMGDEHLQVGPIKIFADGGFTGPAAYTKEPYVGEETYRGKLNMSEHELRALIADAHNDGWQLGIHAIGDAAIELTVDALVNALQATPRADHRHYLNHFTVMPSDATMQTMAEHGIAITQQPNFAYTLEGRYATHLDGARLAHNNPMATPIKLGIHVAMSSDILPLGPGVGIYAATTRKGMSGKVYGPEEAISRLEALRAYTSRGAYLTRAENTKGQLKVGMLADFIVLATDPLRMEDSALLTLTPSATYLGGVQVWPPGPTPSASGASDASQTE
jgi:predicted amidohydrolase YtcJ